MVIIYPIYIYSETIYFITNLFLQHICMYGFLDTMATLHPFYIHVYSIIIIFNTYNLFISLMHLCTYVYGFLPEIKKYSI